MTTEITVSYERKFSDGNYGSEGMSLSMTMPGGDTDAAVLARLLRNIVLGQLAKSEARNVAYAAQRELNPPHNNNLQSIAAGGPAESLEDMPF